jgi:hypothetical protein
MHEGSPLQGLSGHRGAERFFLSNVVVVKYSLSKKDETGLIRRGGAPPGAAAFLITVQSGAPTSVTYPDLSAFIVRVRTPAHPGFKKISKKIVTAVKPSHLFCT